MSGLARTGVAVALLVLGAGIGQATVEGSSAPAARVEVPVVGATAVCPDGPVTAGAVGSGSGELLAGSLDGPPAPSAVTRAGEAAAGLPGPVLRARGAVAAGLAVEQVARRDEGEVRGLTAVRCTPPTTSAWFLGGSTVVGEAADLVLVNADDSAAEVDVRAWSASGPVEARPGRGLAVPARSRTTVPLDRLAPDRELLALHVTTSRGRVAPYVLHRRSDGRTPRGVDWVPAGPAPAAEVVLGGLPSGPGRRTVVLANPGDEDTAVRLELVTADGTLAPVEVAVPAGSTVEQEVSEQLADVPAAVRVRSSGAPVLAAAMVYDLQDGPVRELSWAGAALPLTGPALLADVALSAPSEQTLLVSALVEDAVVEVVPVPVLGADGTSSVVELPAPRRVEVAAGTLVPVRLSTFVEPGATARLAFEVRPVAGQVHASRYLRERTATGPLTALLPVVSAVPTVERPRVEADPLAGRPLVER